MANVETATPPSSPAAAPTPAASAAPLLISLPSTTADLLPLVLQRLEQALAGLEATVISPDVDESSIATRNGLSVLPMTDGTTARGGWVLRADDFQNAARQVQSHNASAIVLLGPDAQTMEPEAIRRLVHAVTVEKADLGTPDYVIGPHEGLVNSAMLYPVTRALLGTAARFPLAIDLSMSARMAQRLGDYATRMSSSPDGAGLLWPVAEAASAGYRITSVPAGRRALPAPDAADLNSLLSQVAGSLFTDIEARAAYWQRSRPAPPFTTTGGVQSPGNAEPSDVQPLIESFRVGYTNLNEIWSLVLPPQSLLGLKRLAAQPLTDFRMPAGLWARVIYDFILAFRLRTLNRGHLLGALTPLYLAWVASHLQIVDLGGSPEQHVQETAKAFEAEKAYFVSRWRWPDRFNP